MDYRASERGEVITPQHDVERLLVEVTDKRQCPQWPLCEMCLWRMCEETQEVDNGQGRHILKR